MLKLLIVLVIILGIIAVAQLAKVYEISAKLRNKREEEISHADNKLNAVLMIVFMLLFYAGVIYLLIQYGDYLPPAASEHGEGLDQLMLVNMYIILGVFFLVHTFLFYFSFKYYYRKDRKAKFFPHDSRLELVWTIIPSIVLAFIIIYGLRTWNDITDEASEGALQIEVYGKQFDWTVRYPGDDNAFGAANFNLISTNNPLGLITDTTMQAKMTDLDNQVEEIEATLNSPQVELMPASKVEALEDKKYRLIRHKQRILDLEDYDIRGVSGWEAGKDDRIVKGEFHLPVGREVEMIIRSRDVIHSVYLPHLRAQMNAVPGLPTRFKMTPTITTDSMKMITNDPNFEYILLCNKICGSAHFNMQMNLVIDSEEDYEAWLAQQDTFVASDASENEPTDPLEEVEAGEEPTGPDTEEVDRSEDIPTDEGMENRERQD